jgi:phosphoglycerate dehydrogenase-like enzyme
MTVKIHLVDPNIHDTVLETLRAAGLSISDTPKDVSALVTQDQSIGGDLLEEAGDRLRAIFLLEPGSADIAESSVSVHSIANSALLGVAEHTVLLMMALGKRLPWILEKTAKKAWLPERSEPIPTDQKKYTYNRTTLNYSRSCAFIRGSLSKE